MKNIRQTQSIDAGRITKIDRTNKITSGTFSFKAENKDDPSDIISVTDGRFDVKYDRF